MSEKLVNQENSRFNFAVWRELLRRADFAAFYREQNTGVLTRYNVVLIGGLVLAPAAVAAAQAFGLPLLFRETEVPLILYLWLLAMVLVSVGATLAWSRVFRREVRLAKFCRANGLTYRARVRNLRVAGTPFRSDYDSMTGPLVSGKFDGETFTLGHHIIINKRNQNKIELYPPFVFARVGLPRKVPHIMLLNKKSRIIPVRDASAARTNAALKLEGDYANQFQLICPRNYERDALYIFTPDVIASIYDFAADAEIELIDDQLFLYTRGQATFRRPEKLIALFDVLRRLNQRFDKQTKRYCDARADRAVASVAADARRLRITSWSWLATLWAAVVVALIVWQVLANL